jgi:hypothetical protein
MKFAVISILAMSMTPLYGQQPWCLSSQCPEPPSVMFGASRNGQPLNLFPAPNIPEYKPVAPLAFSPADCQFFTCSKHAPSGLAPLRLPIITNPAVTSTNPASHVRAVPGSGSAAGRFSLTGPSFSGGNGRLNFHR